VYRKSGIERYLKVRRFSEATRKADGPDAAHRGIAAVRWEELREFQVRHPLEHLTVAGVGQDYIASGEGEETLLLLPGAPPTTSCGSFDNTLGGRGNVPPLLDCARAPFQRSYFADLA
jgi:hypothetical protein